MTSRWSKTTSGGWGTSIDTVTGFGMYHMVRQDVPCGTVQLMPPGGARQHLLDAAIDYVAGHGLTDLSLRRLAAGLGTSHRMLSHHFGSKEGLWVAIIHEVERRELEAIRGLVPDASVPFGEAMRAWWRHISDPA